MRLGRGQSCLGLQWGGGLDEGQEVRRARSMGALQGLPSPGCENTSPWGMERACHGPAQCGAAAVTSSRLMDVPHLSFAPGLENAREGCGRSTAFRGPA